MLKSRNSVKYNFEEIAMDATKTQAELKEILELSLERYKDDTDGKAMGFQGLGAAVVAQTLVQEFGAETLGDTEQQIDITKFLLDKAINRMNLDDPTDQNSLVFVDAAELAISLIQKNPAISKRFDDMILLFTFSLEKLVAQTQKPLVAARAGDALLRLSEIFPAWLEKHEIEDIKEKVRSIAADTNNVIGVKGLAVARAIEAKERFGDSISTDKGTLMRVFNENSALIETALTADILSPDHAAVATQMLAVAGAGKALASVTDYVEQSPLSRSLFGLFKKAAELDDFTGRAVYGVAADRLLEALVMPNGGKSSHIQVPLKGLEILSALYERNVARSRGIEIGMQPQAAARAVPILKNQGLFV